MLVTEQVTGLKRFGFDDSDPLLIWLNAAMHELERAHPWSWLETVTTVNSLVGASVLNLPSAARKVISVKDLTHAGIKLQAKERTQFDREISNPTSTGKAAYYVVTGFTTLQLWPVLDEATTYQVWYRKRLLDVALADTMQIPDDLHYSVIQGAAAIGLQAESEEDRSANARAQFQASIASAIAEDTNSDSDEPKSVVDVMGYGADYGYC